MDNNTIALKIRQRLNKLSSNDSANIECWQIVEAFNKGQSDWARRDQRGANMDRQGDEQSTTRIDDLQPLLLDTPILPTKEFDQYQETINTIPADYMRWKRFIATASLGKCVRSLKVYLGTESEVNLYLQDKERQPNFSWGETFAVLKGNKIQIYTGGKFKVDSLQLVYYRQPRKIQILNCKDPYTGNTSTVNVECEFKDDVCEILIDEAAKIIAGDIEAQFQYTRNDKSVKEDT